MKLTTLSPYKPLLLLGAGCCLSASLIAWEWWRIPALSERHTELASVSTLPEANTLAESDKPLLAPLQAYQAMVTLPLFFEGRKELVGVDDTQQDDELTLTGIVLAPEGFVALIRDKEGAYYRLNPGSAYEGWTVANVEKDRVELTKDTQSRELLLFESAYKPDLTAEDLEACFKNQANLPLEDCFRHPEKFTHKTPLSI